VQHDTIAAVIRTPDERSATIKLRCRTPSGKKIRAVTINGEAWTDFSAEQEVVIIPPQFKSEINLQISY